MALVTPSGEGLRQRMRPARADETTWMRSASVSLGVSTPSDSPKKRRMCSASREERKVNCRPVDSEAVSASGQDGSGGKVCFAPQINDRARAVGPHRDGQSFLPSWSVYQRPTPPGSGATPPRDGRATATSNTDRVPTPCQSIDYTSLEGTAHRPVRAILRPSLALDGRPLLLESDTDVNVQQYQRPKEDREDRRAHGRHGIQRIKEMVCTGDDQADHDPDNAAQGHVSTGDHVKYGTTVLIGPKPRKWVGGYIRG